MCGWAPLLGKALVDAHRVGEQPQELVHARDARIRVVCADVVVTRRPGLDEERCVFGRDQLQNVDPERVVSIDETSFYFDMKPTHGYCHRSARLRMPCKVGGRARWSMLMAVTTDGIAGWTLVKGSFNGAMFTDFVNGLDTQGRDVLLMDNASIHKTQSTLATLHARCMTPLFLPPYTPQFQPIEHIFSVIKNAYRRLTSIPAALPTTSVMQDRIVRCLPHVTNTVLSNVFTACWRRGLLAAEASLRSLDEPHDDNVLGHVRLNHSDTT